MRTAQWAARANENSLVCASSGNRCTGSRVVQTLRRGFHNVGYGDNHKLPHSAVQGAFRSWNRLDQTESNDRVYGTSKCGTTARGLSGNRRTRRPEDNGTCKNRSRGAIQCIPGTSGSIPHQSLARGIPVGHWNLGSHEARGQSKGNQVRASFRSLRPTSSISSIGGSQNINSEGRYFPSSG
jgi:hypothetical protein